MFSFSHSGEKGENQAVWQKLLGNFCVEIPELAKSIGNLFAFDPEVDAPLRYKGLETIGNDKLANVHGNYGQKILIKTSDTGADTVVD